MLKTCVSIRSLAITLSVSSVLLITVLMVIMTTNSTEEALNNLKGSRDISVSECFDVSEETITAKTEELLITLGNSTEQYLLSFLEDKRLVTVSLVREMEMYPSRALQWDYVDAVRRGMWQTMLAKRSQGVTGISLTTRAEHLVTYFEDDGTLSRPDDAFHHFRIEMNNGTEHDVPGQMHSRSGTASVDVATGEPYGGLAADTGCEQYTAVATNGTNLEEWCPFRASMRPTENDIYTSMTLLTAFYTGQGPENAHWSAFVELKQHLGLLGYASFRDENGGHAGIVYTGIDVRTFTTFLSSIRIGDSAKGRLFTLVRRNWELDKLGGPFATTYDTQEHWLSGVSHGNSIVWRDGKARGMRPVNASDVLISNCAKYIATLPDANGTVSSSNGMYESLEGKGVHRFNMSSTQREEGNFTEDIEREEFFVMVRCVNDGHGVDWYMTLLIDRQYMLGEVDRVLLATKNRIKEREEEMDSDLERARMVLYITIALAGVGLVGASVILVIKITAPLLVLESEMAEVALMRLDGVMQRPISSLVEVGRMQVSFATLLRNLKEYRNYMPLSVLQDDDSDDDMQNASDTVSVSMSAGRSSRRSECGDTHSVTSRGSSVNHLQETAIGKATSMDLRKRTITVAALNLRGFHKVSMCDLGALHAKYISAVLQHSKEMKGVPDMFTGDKVLVAFNSLKPCSSHSTAGCKFAKRVVDVVGRDAVVCTAGVTTGEVKCGNLGSQGMKKYSVVGTCLTWATLLEKLSGMFDCSIVTEGRVAAVVKSLFYAPLMGVVAFPKLVHNFEVFAVCEEHKRTGDEWMYELQEADRQDPYKGWSTAMQMYLNGDYVQALAALEVLTPKDWLASRCATLKQEVNKALATGAQETAIRVIDLKYY